MARRIPEDRLPELIEAATRVFIAQGYRRTQMADVARVLGVAKGTLYLYVESKEALFEAALEYADRKPPPSSELELPLPTPAPGALERTLRGRLEEEAVPRSLSQAAARVAPAQRQSAVGEIPRDGRAELERIVRDLFAVSRRHRVAVKLIDRCGAEHPELATAFYEGGRFMQLEVLARYLAARSGSGQLRPLPDPALAARFVIETIATWAIHLHWDPAPQAFDPEDIENTVLQFVLAGLLPEGARREHHAKEGNP